MKHLNYKLLYLSLATLFLVSCDSDEDLVIFEGGNPPALTVSSTADLVLTKQAENFNSLQFQWTNPEYQFSNGVNTQDVQYALQISVAGANFSQAKTVELAYSKDLIANFKVSQLNTALAGLELSDFELHNFQFRVRASLSGGSVPTYSNVIPVSIATYLDVVFPVPDNLYITGAATPANWMGGGDAPVAAQEFMKINAYTFQIEALTITGGNPFLFVPVYGNWDNKYGFTGEGSANNPNGDFFRPGGNDMVSPSATKSYKITVNFKTGKYSFE